MNSSNAMITVPALQPRLQTLIDRGVLSRAELAEESFVSELYRAVSRGEVTRGQADTMEHMLGVSHRHE